MSLTRTVFKHRMIRFVVFVVACMLAAPASSTDDYFLPGLSGSASSVIPASRIDTFLLEYEDGPEEAGCCPCLLCFQSLDETFAPLFLPPRYRPLEEDPSFIAAVSPCVRDIFHPPIS